MKLSSREIFRFLIQEKQFVTKSLKTVNSVHKITKFYYHKILFT